jgi:hypothetical protein
LCLYTDFSKAFDILDHGIILKDFYGNEYYQLAGFLLNWIATYLSELINKVGQILFDVGFLIYADELKIIKVIRTLADCQKLQSVLDAFHQWCFQNKLVLNVRKCNIMSFT